MEGEINNKFSAPPNTTLLKRRSCIRYKKKTLFNQYIQTFNKINKLSY